jgi:integrase
MPTPTLRSDGRWMLQLPREPGKSRRCVYGRTQDEVMRRYNEAIGAGAFRVRPGSISEFVVVHFEPFQRSRIQRISVERYHGVWLCHVGKTFGHLLFSELTPAIIQNGLLAGDAAPATRQMAKSLLGQIVKLAVSMELCEPHVIHMVSIARLPKAAPKRRTDVARLVNAVIDRAQAAGHHIAGPLWVAATLGLRKGELCGLKITDLSGSTLAISRQRNHKEGEKGRLKARLAGESRSVGLPDWIADRLRSFWNGESVYLFTRPDGKPISYQHFDREFEPFQDPENRITAHDFRAAAICNLIEAGVSDHVIMDIVGHGSAEMIRWYRDVDNTRVKDALSRLRQPAGLDR